MRGSVSDFSTIVEISDRRRGIWSNGGMPQLANGNAAVRAKAQAPPVTIMRSAPPAFDAAQRAHFEAIAKERLQAMRKNGQVIANQVMPMSSHGFWDHAHSRGFEKVARGYAALLARPSERESLEWWVVDEAKHIHRILYLNQWESHTAIADLSAVAVWDFPRLEQLPKLVQRVELTRNHHSRSANQVTRRARVEPEVVDLGGVLVTSIEQTIVDVCCGAGPEAGLVIADFALHNNLTDMDRLESLARAQGPRRGIRNFWAMARVADGRVESPNESLMRWRFHAGGFEVPESQVRIRYGRSERRPDGFDAASRTIYEADGKGKYSLHRAGIVEAFHDERERDAELEALGFRVLHMTWNDVQNDIQFGEWCRRFKVFPTPAKRRTQRGKR